MAWRSRAQREWEPGQVRPPRSVKALFASTVLCLEAALMFFFGLAAWGLNQNEWYAWWIFAVACLVAVVCVALCAVLHRPIGYPAGWVMQGIIVATFVGVALITSEGLIVPLALLPGLGFAACWWYAVRRGAQIDAEKMERYRAEEELAAEADSEENTS
jgi:Na+/melibiose symporter-like transporter